MSTETTTDQTKYGEVCTEKSKGPYSPSMVHSKLANKQFYRLLKKVSEKSVYVVLHTNKKCGRGGEGGSCKFIVFLL